MKSIPAEQISRINFFFDVIEYWIVAVSYYAAALLFKFLKVIYDKTAKEGSTVFECRFIYNDLGSHTLNSFHDTLNGRLPEVV